MADRGGAKRVRDWTEGLFARLAFAFFRLLPLDAASAFGGFLARSIGPVLGISKRARLNLQRALPGLSDADIRRIVRGMWDNLGRVVAEYPHLDKFKVYEPGGRVTVEGVREALGARGPAMRFIFFSAHFGNWEIATLAATQAGLDVIEIYRAANNPFVDEIINEARSVTGGELVPKGSAAARRAIGALAEGKHICMLVDQKMNDGIAVPFFGRDAMTAPALARLALRYDCVVLPCRVERVSGATFRFVADPPIPLPRTGDGQADVKRLMTAVNAAVEGWIRHRPEQWFWLHRRWPD
ncbi:MAG TPA: lipid A biosynthesis lauroyl acyltransferase [Stellaceae bacterium]|nr:lipid A biosynthesis lauroyl acyltransferase [Stellaceae bacterium]